MVKTLDTLDDRAIKLRGKLIDDLRIADKELYDLVLCWEKLSEHKQNDFISMYKDQIQNHLQSIGN